MSDSCFDSLRQNRLVWLPDLGVGYYPVAAEPYDHAYWSRYCGLDRTRSGDALTAMRRDLVARYWPGAVVDIGIGGGRFVYDRPNTRGFDVNPYAVDWLQSRGSWCDPYSEQVDAVTFWDSLEHIHDPRPLLANVRRFVFVSCPIFNGPDHALRSRHYRPDEHCWYFEREGLEMFMATFGFRLLHCDTREQDAGREDIESFVFCAM